MLQNKSFHLEDRILDRNRFVLDDNIIYCLVESRNASCRLDISLSILIIVLIYNVIKTTCFILIFLVANFMFSLITNKDIVMQAL